MAVAMEWSVDAVKLGFGATNEGTEWSAGKGTGDRTDLVEHGVFRTAEPARSRDGAWNRPF